MLVSLINTSHLNENAIRAQLIPSKGDGTCAVSFIYLASVVSFLYTVCCAVIGKF